MANVIKKLIASAHHFTGADFAVFKICLIFIGILLGSYFRDFFMQFTLIVWVVAVISLVWLINQTIRYYNIKSKE